MKASDISQAIERAAAYALKQEPNDEALRARCFVAGLSGALEQLKLAAAKSTWALISTEPLDTAAECTK